MIEEVVSGLSVADDRDGSARFVAGCFHTERVPSTPSPTERVHVVEGALAVEFCHEFAIAPIINVNMQIGKIKINLRNVSRIADQFSH